MTLPRTCLAAFVLLVATLACAGTAAAATASQVLADWRADGTIDGDYTLSELRAADAQINDQEREYTFWDEAYAEAVRRVNNPNAPESRRPPTVPPQDDDGDGRIEPAEIAAAKVKTQRLRAKLRMCQSGNPADRPIDCPANTVDRPEAEPRDDKNEPIPGGATDDDEDNRGAGWLAALLFVVPAAVIGFGAWRMQRGRRSGRRSLEPDVPTTSFSRGDDLT